jgi:hypothetical protein
LAIWTSSFEKALFSSFGLFFIASLIFGEFDKILFFPVQNISYFLYRVK